MTGNTQILAYTEHRRTALLWRVVCNAFLYMLASSRDRTKPERRRAKGIVGNDRERGVIGALRQAQQGFRELARRV